MKLHMKRRGVLDVFESNKESILIYHLASLEAKKDDETTFVIKNNE